MLSCLGMADLLRPLRATSRISWVFPANLGKSAVRAAFFTGLSYAPPSPDPAEYRARIRLASIPANARPLGVVRSSASLRETNPTFSAVSSCKVA
jgi:hypothetical protein